METNHKQFKPFEKVLVKAFNNCWRCTFYSHWDSKFEKHLVSANTTYYDNDILPYEGNEHLVGTTDEPEEEVKLEEGEWVMVCDSDKDYPGEWLLRSVMYPQNDKIMVQSVRFAHGDATPYNYCIRFSDFNPNDMEETKKHILCVKNSKIVKYKG